MASPFTVFRKYQAVLLAVFGVVIIIIFAIGDSLNKQYSSHGVAIEDPVVVTWSGGKITRNRLLGMIQSRRLAVEILTRLQNTAWSRRGKNEDEQSYQLRQAAIQYNVRQYLPPDQRIMTEQDLIPEQTLNAMLLATKAQQLGLMVTNDDIRTELSRLVSNKVSEAEMHQMIEGPPDAPAPMKEGDLFDPMRQQMLAIRLVGFLHDSLQPMPPAERLEYYTRLHQSVQADMIAIPVDTFLGKVPDPSEAELTRYFDQYKQSLPTQDFLDGRSLPSPQPGFKLPPRIAVEYLTANYLEFEDRSRPEVTEKDIVKYYESHKDTDATLQQSEFLKPDEEKPAAKKQTPSGTPHEPAKKDHGGAPSKTAPGESGKPAGTAPPSPAAMGPHPPLEPAKSPPSAPGPTKSAPQKAASDKAAPSATPTPRLNSDSGPGAADAVALSDPLAQGAPPVGATPDKSGSAKPAVDKPAADKSAADKGAAKPAAAAASADKGNNNTPAKPQPNKTATGKAATDKGAMDKGTAKAGQKEGPPAKSKPKYRPLSEVRDEIHQRLTKEKATQKINDIFKVIEKILTDYNYNRERVARDKTGNPPARPNFVELANRYKLTAHKTDLLTEKQVGALADIGQSVDSSGRPFAEIMFREFGDNTLLRPLVTQDKVGNEYLAWKTEQKGAMVPELKGPVREYVVREWKLGAGLDPAEKARGLAMAAAQRLAEAARKGTPLAQLAKSQSGAHSFKTNAFTWLTSGDTPQMFARQTSPPRLGQIDGVEDPGPEFMQTVYQLPAGGVGVAMNHPQTIVYVIRAHAWDRSPSVLQDNFLASMATESLDSEIRGAIAIQWSRVQLNLLKSLEKEFDVKWDKPSHRYSLDEHRRGAAPGSEPEPDLPPED